VSLGCNLWSKLWAAALGGSVMITESVSFPFLFFQEVGTADALLARVCRPRMSMTDGTDAMSYANLQQSAALQGTITESQERLSIL